MAEHRCTESIPEINIYGLQGLGILCGCGSMVESKGIIKDNGDHKFRPDDAVTRVELAKFIYYAYK